MGPLVFRVDQLLIELGPVAVLFSAVLFALAATTKLIDRQSTVDDFQALGVPWPKAVATLVPPIELAIAITIMFRPALGAILGCLALIAFTGVVAAAIRSGRRVTCGCLGPLSKEPISVRTLGRNAILTSIVALAGTTPSDGWALRLPSGQVVLVVGLTVGLAVLAVELVRLRAQLGRLWSVSLAGEPASDRAGAHRRRSQLNRPQSAADVTEGRPALDLLESNHHLEARQ